MFLHRLFFFEFCKNLFIFYILINNNINRNNEKYLLLSLTISLLFIKITSLPLHLALSISLLHTIYVCLYCKQSGEKSNDDGK